MQFLSFLFTLIIIAYLLAWCLRYVFPRIAVWLLRRHLRKQAAQPFGGGFDPFNPFGYDASAQNTRRNTRRRSGKIIAKDVGEYVEFEDLPGAPKPRFSPSSFVPTPQVSDADWEEIR